MFFALFCWPKHVFHGKTTVVSTKMFFLVAKRLILSVLAAPKRVLLHLFRKKRSGVVNLGVKCKSGDSWTSLQLAAAFWKPLYRNEKKLV